MHTAIWGKNVISKRLHGFGVGIIVLEGNFYGRVADLLVYIENIIREDLFAVIEALDVTLDTTFEIEGLVLASALI